ncbi:MAG: hypothetical protein APU95_00170 [Hadesarchaea archaeon YNP_N21]|nr:MAG: hypothetical protein APU95_00170 [Hadesarchaea archaeon YNP_N21]
MEKLRKVRPRKAVRSNARKSEPIAIARKLHPQIQGNRARLWRFKVFSRRQFSKIGKKSIIFVRAAIPRALIFSGQKS